MGSMQDARQGFYGDIEGKDFDLTLFVNDELDSTAADEFKVLADLVWQGDLPGIGDGGAEHSEKG